MFFANAFFLPYRVYLFSIGEQHKSPMDGARKSTFKVFLLAVRWPQAPCFIKNVLFEQKFFFAVKWPQAPFILAKTDMFK